jgi:hypothetical protein
MLEYVRQIQSAYLGERYGVALFGTLVEYFRTEPARRHKLERLRDLELVTGYRLSVLLERHRVQAADSRASEAAAGAKAPEVAKWGLLIETLLLELPEYVLKYDALVAKARPEDEPELQFLAVTSAHFSPSRVWRWERTRQIPLNRSNGYSSGFHLRCWPPRLGTAPLWI